MTTAAEFGSPIPAQEERTMAILAHVLQLVGWWIAPLVIFLVKRESRFVSFHALQALLLQVVYMIIMGAFMLLWVASIVLMAGTQHQGGQAPPAMFILFPLIWLGFMGMWVLMLVVAILYGIKAGRGEWAEYPLIGRLARKLLKIGPAGAFPQTTS